MLPLDAHWDWVASHAPLTLQVVPLANYSSRGPVAAGGTHALHRFGTYDLAGNVKESCANEAEAGKRYHPRRSLGRAAVFSDADARSPFDRSANFGFRCVKHLDGDQSRLTLAGSVAAPTRDYAP
jgi:eukaryotic-like serine/threonine-protein kinase